MTTRSRSRAPRRRPTFADESRARLASFDALTGRAPLGTIAAPLPMFDPNVEAPREEGRRNRARVEDALAGRRLTL